MLKCVLSEIIADSIEAVSLHASVVSLFLTTCWNTGGNGSNVSLSTFIILLTVIQAQHYDGNISIPACDKNMPGCAMAAGK